MGKRNYMLVRLMIWGLAAWFLIPPEVYAQPASETIPPKEITEKRLILLDLLRSINFLEQELQETQKELLSPQSEGRKDELKQQIQTLSSKLTTLKTSLTEVASGVDLGVFSKSEPTEIDWKKHAFDLLRPILNELSRLTARPREIEQLHDFLAQSPQVLSTGFRLGVTFGIDYQHQAIITRKIPTRIDSALHEALADAGYTEHLANLAVEFAEAGASSLDIEVLADFFGAAAPQYFILRRTIQRICVDACNANGWVIPFTQLTLHVASPNGKISVPMLTDAAEDAL